MEKYLLRLLLNYSFWKENKSKFFPDMFPPNMQKLYELIIKKHEKTKKDLLVPDIKALYKTTYPTTTKAQWDLLEEIIDDLPGEITEDVAKEVIQKAYILEQGRQLSNLGIDITNGKEADFAKIRAILQKITEGGISEPDDFQPISSELEDVLAALDVTTKWSFNLGPLREVCSGIGPGIFTIVAARTEVGKSAFGISICAAPGGLAEQGAKIHFYCNEESPQRTQGRAIMAYTGMPLQELLLTPDKAKAKYAEIKDRLKFFDCRGRSIDEIGQHINRHNPDACIIDQLDKLTVKGTFAREDERLGALYVAARDIGSAYGSSIIAITQLNADAEGKYYISSINLSNARTAKAAEGDLVLGIGKNPNHTDNMRQINIIKNKITGSHKDVICSIRPEISRYVV